MRSCTLGRLLLATVACATVASAAGFQVQAPRPSPRSHVSPARCLRTESRVVSLRMRGEPIHFYYWPVPCGWKVAIMLEECTLPYRLHPVNILQGDQFDPAYLALNPNNKVRKERKAARVAGAQATKGGLHACCATCVTRYRD
jgi:hypothetical protein